MRKATIIGILIIAISLILALGLYQQMPEKMASHWNASGEVDGYMSKFLGLFLMPIITIFMFLLFLALPKIDPLKKNIEKFRNYFDGFIIMIMLFMLYIYILTIFWNLGHRFNMVIMMVPSFAILFYYAGVLTENAKRNWFIGIRTPWTLSNDKVWEKTNKLGGKLFKISAVISLAGLFAGKYAILLVIVPVLATALYTVIYSYVEFKKQ